MRVRCFMRELRGDQTLSSVAARLGMAKGELSMIERGHQIPRDDEVPALEREYGPREEWYLPTIRRALAPDMPLCAGCGEELDPGARRSRRYHEECRR